MKIEGEGKRVTVYVGRADTWHGRNLAVAIVERCREMGMAGATVSRGVMGFGKHSVIHKAHLLGLSDDLPEKIEIIDRAEEIDRLLPALDEMIGGGLIVVEDVHVVRYVHEPKAGHLKMSERVGVEPRTHGVRGIRDRATSTESCARTEKASGTARSSTNNAIIRATCRPL